MESHKALKATIGDRAKEFAKRLGLASSTVYKWTEPSADYTDSGSRNPLDVIEQITEISLALNDPRANALASIFCLNERFNLITIEAGLKPSKDGISQDFFKSIKEFGDLAKETSKALEDGSLTSEEAKAIDKEGWETIRAIAAFIAKVKTSAGREHGQNR